MEVNEPFADAVREVIRECGFQLRDDPWLIQREGVREALLRLVEQHRRDGQPAPDFAVAFQLQDRSAIHLLEVSNYTPELGDDSLEGVGFSARGVVPQAEALKIYLTHPDDLRTAFRTIATIHSSVIFGMATVISSSPMITVTLSVARFQSCWGRKVAVATTQRVGSRSARPRPGRLLGYVLCAAADEAKVIRPTYHFCSSGCGQVATSGREGDEGVFALAFAIVRSDKRPCPVYPPAERSTTRAKQSVSAFDSGTESRQ